MYFASPTEIAPETYEATRTLQGKIAFFNSFNNAIYVGRQGGTYTVRATKFAALGIAKGGFNVTSVEGTADTWTVVRAYSGPSATDK